MNQFHRHHIIVSFDDQRYAFGDAQVESVEPIVDSHEGDKISTNVYFIGRISNIFYSIELRKVEQLNSSDQSSAPLSLIKLLAQYFFKHKVICGVIGCKVKSTRFTPEVQQQAFSAGQIIAEFGFTTLTGGLSGVMEKAAQGAQHAAGVTLGILPGSEKNQANPFIGHVIPSGIGYARNYILAQTSDILIALNGGRGTLEEICFGLDFNKKVLSLNSWEIPEVIKIEAIDDIKTHLYSLFTQHFLFSLNSKFEDKNS